MCKHPISLRNPSVAWNLLQDTIDIMVPCGHCQDCETQKRLDWQVRVWYEYLRCHKIGGFVLFVTLTYNDGKLPLAYVNKSGRASVKPRHRKEYHTYLDSVHNRQLIVHETDEVIPDQVMSCFSREDLQRFTENCKDSYRRRGEKFGYFITSEYGKYEPYIDDHGRPVCGTSRPHYHCLFFFDGSISVQEAKKVIEDHWSEYGFVAYGDKRGDISTESGIVSGPGAIGYVCKYLQKSRDNAEQLRQHLLINSEAWLHKDLRKLNRNFMPFNTQSYGIGLYILEATPEELLAQGKTYFPMYDKNSKGRKIIKLELLDLPLYIYRKRFCLPQSETPNRAYILNEEGLELKAQKMLTHRDELISEITDMLDHPSQYITPNLLQQINRELGRSLGEPGYYFRPKDYANDIKRKLLNYSVKSLVDYLLLFQGMADLDKLNEPLNEKNDEYIQYYKEYLPSIQSEVFKDLAKIKYRKDRSSPYKLTDQTHKVYHAKRIYIAPLEQALKLYGAYNQAVSYGQSAYKDQKLSDELRNEDIYWRNKNGTFN